MNKEILKIFLFAMMLLSPLSSIAQEKVVVHLTDGSKKTGYFPKGVKRRCKRVAFCETKDGKAEKIELTAIKSVYYPDTKSTSYAVYYDPKPIPSKSPKKSKHPQLMELMYKGKKMTIYCVPIIVEERRNGFLVGSYKEEEYYVILPDFDMARGVFIYCHAKLSISLGYQWGMKKVFANYPKVVEYIDSKDFNYKLFKNNPVEVLKIMEKLM